MIIGNKSRLLFVGDSITDCGRDRPAGRSQGLGNGYVKIVHGLINAVYPDYGIKVLNTGVSGDTVRDLKRRWDSDVLMHEPDCLSIMIGINDVWRQFNRHFEERIDVGIDEYFETLEYLLSVSKETISDIIVMSPYFIEPNKEDSMRKMMDIYIDAAEKAAKKHGAIFVDVQKAFDEVLMSIPSASLALDRVHPEAVGHTVIARAFLQAVGFDFDRAVLV